MKSTDTRSQRVISFRGTTWIHVTFVYTLWFSFKQIERWLTRQRDQQMARPCSAHFIHKLKMNAHCVRVICHVVRMICDHFFIFVSISHYSHIRRFVITRAPSYFTCGKTSNITKREPWANVSLQWHHKRVRWLINHRRIYCLSNRLLRRRSKKTSKLRATGLCDGNPVTDGFPSQWVSK